MEKIYTIPVNEAFDACAEDKSLGCPFCQLYNRLEENELELILGASMMEPDVRIKTNEQGFFYRHYAMMLRRKNRLGLALMLESHLDQVRKDINSRTAEKKIERLNESCYVCSRGNYQMSRMIETAAWLYNADPEFVKKIKSQPYFCLNHYGAFLKAGKDSMNKKKYPDFEEIVTKVTCDYLDTLKADVSWFCKKFDYRYDEEPWGNAKDAPERAIKFLSGDVLE